MKKLIIIVFVISLSFIIAISGYSSAKISNEASLKIVPPEQALIAISIQKPFKITVHKQGTEDCFVTPPQGKADIKITNHSTNDLTIKSITCTTGGFSGLVTSDFKLSLPADRTMPAKLEIGDSSLLVGIDSLEFEFEAEWEGGKALIKFSIPVDKHADNGQQEEGDNGQDAPADLNQD